MTNPMVHEILKLPKWGTHCDFLKKKFNYAVLRGRFAQNGIRDNPKTAYPKFFPNKNSNFLIFFTIFTDLNILWYPI